MAVKEVGGATPDALRVMMFAHASSLAALLLLCWIVGFTRPYGAPLVWGLVGGMTVAFSTTAFYVALSRGSMGPSAAISGLVAAAIPAVVSSFLEGSPGWLRLCGFALAAAAIWAIAAGDTPEAPGTMLLAVGAGLGFGLYFVAMRLARPLGVFETMTLTRAASASACTLLWLLVRRGAKAAPFTRAVFGWSLGIAVLDTGGCLLFILATRFGRLDSAAVLASLYPAGTILLAAWRLHERPSRRQIGGMLLALVAVVMITL
jgi:drug/metabolite transporter (DMT)-like permease